MQQADEISAMVPYLFYELMDSLGGIVDLDADRVLELIKSEQKRGLAVSISNGKLRVEILEKDEIDADEN